MRPVHQNPCAIVLFLALVFGPSSSNAMQVHESFAAKVKSNSGKTNNVNDILNDGLIFHATFDQTTDANLFGDDGWIYTAESASRKTIRKGNHCKEATIIKGAGISGDCLRFSAESRKILFYKANGNDLEPRPNWSGTVSFWLKLDPNKDLRQGSYCDPIQITQRKWNDGAMWVDFDTTTPRTFRLGTFSDLNKWNPKNQKLDAMPEVKIPRATVNNPPFSREKWTHVLFTFSDVNSTTNKKSKAKLYLNGKLAGTINQKLEFSWTQPLKDHAEPALMIGINYVGDLDELAIYDRAFDAKQADALYRYYAKPDKT